MSSGAILGVILLNCLGLALLLTTENPRKPRGGACCCGMTHVPAGAHFAADTARIHTAGRCQPLDTWAARGGRL